MQYLVKYPESARSGRTRRYSPVPQIRSPRRTRVAARRPRGHSQLRPWRRGLYTLLGLRTPDRLPRSSCENLTDSLLADCKRGCKTRQEARRANGDSACRESPCPDDCLNPERFVGKRAKIFPPIEFSAAHWRKNSSLVQDIGAASSGAFEPMLTNRGQISTFPSAPWWILRR